MSADNIIEREYLPLYHFLKKVLARLRILRAVEGSILIVSGAAVICLMAASSLAAKSILPYAPFVVSIISLLSFTFLLGFTVVRMLKVPSHSVIARRVEERYPYLKDNLTNSLALFHSAKDKLHGGDLSRSLLAAQLAMTSQQVSTLSPGHIIELKQIANYVKLIVPLALTFIVIWVMSPSSLVNSLNLLSRPWASLPPLATYLDIMPKGATVAKGSPFLVTASTWGKIPQEMQLRVWTDGGHESVTTMESEGEGRFRYLLRSVDESFRYQSSSRGYSSPIYRAEVVPLPEVEKVRLTLFPPEYSQLPLEVQTGGHISALKGTVIKFDITPTKEISEGKLVLSKSNLVPLKKTKDSRLEGSLILLSEGSYHIALKDELGFGNPSPLQYQIRILPDEVPRIEMVVPNQDQQVIGDETLPLVYNASDDFGITELRLGFRLLGKREQKITLWKGSAQRRFILQEFRWDLDSLALVPGDRLDYWLEVVDNDTISGPKEGYSKNLSLIVRDLLKEVTKGNQEIKEIADALLELLADHLEGSAGEPSRANVTREELTSRARDILKQVDNRLARFAKGRDPNDPARYDLEALHRNLATTVERMENAHPEAVTSQLERMVLLAEDMAKRARVENLQALAQDIRNRERRFLSQLEELKDTMTEAGKNAALQELARLQDLVNKLMNALTQLADKLPEDFINSDALKDMEFQEMFQGLEEIARKLKQGDLEGALQAARELLRSLSQMLAALAQARIEAQMAPFDRLGSEMANNQSELSRIIAAQQEILNKTEELNQELEKRKEAFAARRLEEMLEDARGILKELARVLPLNGDQETASDIERLLDPGNLGEFSNYLEHMREELSEENPLLQMSDSSRSALLEKLETILQKLSPEASEMAGNEEKDYLVELARQEESLGERTRSIRERLEILSQILPMMDSGLTDDIGQAAEFMDQAQKRLRRHDPPRAIPPEREALKRLTKSQQGIQALSQQMAQRAGRQGWRAAWGYDPRAGWYLGPWESLPTLPQPTLEGFRREQGYTGIEKEEFSPPSKDAYQVPKMFREEIMKALKEDYPSEYQKQVQKYFQNLTE